MTGRLTIDGDAYEMNDAGTWSGPDEIMVMRLDSFDGDLSVLPPGTVAFWEAVAWLKGKGYSFKIDKAPRLDPLPEGVVS